MNKKSFSEAAVPWESEGQLFLRDYAPFNLSFYRGNS